MNVIITGLRADRDTGLPQRESRARFRVSYAAVSMILHFEFPLGFASPTPALRVLGLSSLLALGCTFDASGTSGASRDTDEGSTSEGSGTSGADTTSGTTTSSGTDPSSTSGATLPGTTTEPPTTTTTSTEATTDEDTDATSSTPGTDTEASDTGTTGTLDESTGFYDDSGPVGTGYPGLRWFYYGGTWEMLPDFSALTPDAEGEVENFNIYAYEGSSGDNYAMVFEGAIKIPRNGRYTFYLRSDDGSRLYLGGRRVIDHDGLHDTSERLLYTNNFQAGFVEIRVEYFEGTATESLSVTWEGPEFPEEQGIPDEALFYFVE